MGYLHSDRGRFVIPLLFLLGLSPHSLAQTGANVLLVVNGSSAISRQVGEYYRPRRSVPAGNVCTLSGPPKTRKSTGKPMSARSKHRSATVSRRPPSPNPVLYIVLTMGVPLKVRGSGGEFLTREGASVDSELALLYAKMKGTQFQRAGPIRNPYYMKRDAPFRHPQFPLYLVTRLAGYDLAEVKAMIDRSLAARNRGKFVIDASGPEDKEGDNWLRNAAILLPESRVILDEAPGVLYNQKDVIGYASWGSNDPKRKQRWLHNEWLPGAIAIEFVSSGARTIKRPPDAWTYTSWEDRSHFWGGSPQGLTADFLHEGATGAAGNTYEPQLAGCARPDYHLPGLLPEGRNLQRKVIIWGFRS